MIGLLLYRVCSWWTYVNTLDKKLKDYAKNYRLGTYL